MALAASGSSDIEKNPEQRKKKEEEQRRRLVVEMALEDEEDKNRYGISDEDIANARASGRYNPFATDSDILGIGIPAGQGGGQGWGLGHRTPRRVGSAEGIQAIVVNVAARADLTGPERAALLATQLTGFSESGGDNRGAIVSFSGADGLAWCGGFVNRIAQETLRDNRSGVYDGITNPLFANNWADYARGHGALRQSGYTPRPGDIITFDRHVGIVTAVEHGRVTYVSGNYSNMVEAVTFDLNHPPRRFTGYSDTQAIARARGIGLSESVMAQSASDAAAPPAPPQEAAAASVTSTPPPTQVTGGETVTPDAPTPLARAVVPAAASSPGLS